MVTRFCVEHHRVPKQRVKTIRASQLPKVAKMEVPTRRLVVKQRRSHGPRSR